MSEAIERYVIGLVAIVMLVCLALGMAALVVTIGTIAVLLFLAGAAAAIVL